MAFLQDIIAELKRPSTLAPGPLHAAYERGVIGMAHGLVGALLAAPAAYLAHGLAPLLVAVLYFVTKEVGDIRRGGTSQDSIEDAAMVGLGALYSGPVIFPAGMLALGVYLMWRGYRK